MEEVTCKQLCNSLPSVLHLFRRSAVSGRDDFVCRGCFSNRWSDRTRLNFDSKLNSIWKKCKFPKHGVCALIDGLLPQTLCNFSSVKSCHIKPAFLLQLFSNKSGWRWFSTCQNPSFTSAPSFTIALSFTPHPAGELLPETMVASPRLKQFAVRSIDDYGVLALKTSLRSNTVRTFLLQQNNADFISIQSLWKKQNLISICSCSHIWQDYISIEWVKTLFQSQSAAPKLPESFRGYNRGFLFAKLCSFLSLSTRWIEWNCCKSVFNTLPHGFRLGFHKAAVHVNRPQNQYYVVIKTRDAFPDM